MRFCFVFVCVLPFCLFSDSLACPGDNWIRFFGSCYLFVKTRQNWFHATTSCHDIHSKLVDIKSRPEDEFLKQTIQQIHAQDDPQTIGYWTSGNDLAREGKWVWGYPSNLTATVTDWHPGEPNNLSQPDLRTEDCIVLWGHDQYHYTWNDQPCDLLDYYICKLMDADGGVIG